MIKVTYKWNQIVRRQSEVCITHVRVLPLPAYSHMPISYKCFVQMFRTNVSYKCFVQMFRTNISYKCFVQMFRTIFSYKCFVQMLRTNESNCQAPIRSVHHMYGLCLPLHKCVHVELLLVQKGDGMELCYFSVLVMLEAPKQSEDATPFIYPSACIDGLFPLSDPKSTIIKSYRVWGFQKKKIF